MVAVAVDLVTTINQTNLVMLMVMPLVAAAVGYKVLAAQVEHMEMLVVLPTLLAAVVVLMLVVVAVLVVSVKQCQILLTLEQQQVDLEHQ
tara:strand:- start:184 stop:453 length:270 start_codon:yes stop_codon:yes gene_type:complete